MTSDNLSDGQFYGIKREWPTYSVYAGGERAKYTGLYRQKTAEHMLQAELEKAYDDKSLD